MSTRSLNAVVNAAHKWEVGPGKFSAFDHVFDGHTGKETMPPLWFLFGFVCA